MTIPLSRVRLTGGPILIPCDASASASTGSAFSRFFAGSPTSEPLLAAAPGCVRAAPPSLERKSKPGPVMRERVYARTRELAVNAGRSRLQVSQTDYEQARRELTGESDRDRQEAVLDAPPMTILAANAWENRGDDVAVPIAC